MPLQIEASGQACGATVHGLDLSQGLGDDRIAELREAWLEHHVLVFPEQDLSDDDLERFTLYFGPFGEDPFIAPIPGREHVIAVCREPDEVAPVFAEGWHSDWSFQEHPPAGTCLYGIQIPTTGGDTLFVNQHRALAEMPAALRSRLEGKRAIHSAGVAYAPDGIHGDADRAKGRSMDIRPSEQARARQLHPVIRPHPESGKPGLFGAPGYIAGFAETEAEEEQALMRELYQWQTRPEFQYRHQWQPRMLVMWDNRSVLHRATGGYEGQARRLHRTTIGAWRPEEAQR